MKILLCIDSMDMGGAETHVLTLAQGLMALGHTVHIAAHTGRLSHKAEAEGIKVLPTPAWRGSVLSLTKLRRALRRIIKRGRYDVVHAHSRAAAFCAARGVKSVKKRRRPRFVVTAHAYFNMKGRRGRMSVWGQRTIAVSQDIKQHLMRHGVSGKRISVISNGIDTARFCPARQAEGGGGIDEVGSPAVVFVSRLDADCSDVAHMLCRIAGRLAAAADSVRIIIVGGGSEHQTIEALAALMNTAIGRQVIQVTGARQDVETVLRGATVFVGVSRAALEAASCGVPVILAGNEGYGGIFQPPRSRDASNLCARGGGMADSERLFEDICRILKMGQGERQALGRRCRDYVEKYYSSAAMARETERIYNNK